MTRTFIRVFYLSSATLMLGSLLFAQAPVVGTPPFSSLGGGPFDTINLGNLNVHFAIPIVHKAGRGIPFNYDLTYETSIYQIVTVSGKPAWRPIQTVNNVASYWGFQGLGPVLTPYVSYSMVQTTAQCFPFPSSTPVSYTLVTYSNFAFYDVAGSVHPFNINFQVASGAPSNGPGGNCPANGAQPTTAQTASAFDSSGYALTVQPPSGGNASGSLAFRDGTAISAPFLTSPPATSSPYAMTDANGNKISFSNGVYTDTLGTSVLTVTGTQPSPTTFTYTSPVGSEAYTVNYSAHNIQTMFGCSVMEYSASNVALVSSIVLPDHSQYTFAYELTPGSTTTYTGRLSQVTLPTGGTIAYSYPATNDGINCSDGTTMGVTRTLTPGGAWQYSRSGSGAAWTTTVTDPASNATAISFQTMNGNFYETSRLAYQGSTSGTLLRSDYTCYNGQSLSSPTSCPTTPINAQLSRITSFHYLPNASGLQSETDSTYDFFGLIDEVDDYDYGVGAVPSSPIRKTITTYNRSLTNQIVDRPSSVVIKDAGNNVKASTSYGYDETALAIPSGTTPQWSSISGSHGNLTSVTVQASGSVNLFRKYTYYNTGVLSTSTDVSTSSTTSGATTTYNYNNTGTPSPSCGNSFVTSISEPVGGMSRTFSWDCNGGVLLSAKDENLNTSSTAYNATGNVFWRPSSSTDENGTTTTYTYSLNSATPPVEFQTESKSATFNSGNSIVDKVTTTDGFGRALFSQTKQSPSSSTYDTIATCYDNFGRLDLTTLPYSTTVATSTTACPSGNAGTKSTYDALSRIHSMQDNTGTSPGSTTFSYNENDTLETHASPSVSKQSEFDGLGRLTSVCEVNSGTTSWPSASCGQHTSATGYLTTYTYDVLGNRTGVTQNAQASANHQTRTYSFDMLSRLVSESNPEANGTAVSYAYDTLSSDAACGTITSAGNLVKRNDAAGNASCYKNYDAFHRVGMITYSSTGTPSQAFVYDSATVNGAAMANSKSHLAEAYTCSGACSSKISDTGFSYSPSGQTTDVYESTPNSGGYYHTSATYWPNGVQETLSAFLASGSTFVPTETYTPDGEGRWQKVSASAAPNPVTSTTYNAAGQVTGITYGSTDTDAFVYDPNTNQMTKYTYAVNGSSEVGTLTWNANRTLGTLAITDPFNASDAQTCTYTHDGLNRVTGVNCGTPWSQTFTYDPFGNLTKSGSISWQPGYNAANNHYTLSGTSYDANGNVTNDTHQSYTWDVNGRPLTVAAKTLTYDALGRMVEKNDGGTITQFVYSPSGTLLAHMSGQSATSVRVPLPHAWAVYGSSSTFNHYEHLDWLGTSRLSTSQARGITSDIAYAPFGEPYASTATSGVAFTGMRSDVAAVSSTATNGLYDFLTRELPPVQGRWLSPDPGSLAVANPSDPQTWNRYAYVGNRPLNTADAAGLLEGPFIGCDDPFDPDCAPPDPCDPNDLLCECPIDEDCNPGSGGGPNPPPPPPIGVPSLPRLAGFGDHETLGLPGGLNAQPLGSLGDLFGLAPNLGCGDFVACGSLGPAGAAGLGFEDADALRLAVPFCVAQPEVCVVGLGLITVGVVGYEGFELYKHFSNNVAQNRQFDEAIRQIESKCGRKLDKGDRRRLHDEITGGGFTLPEIVEIGVGMFCPGE